MSNDKVLTKIKKLLAMASDTRGNENERDNAMRQVQSMLATHNLEIADIEKHGGTTEEGRGIENATFYGRPWARRVVAAAARMLFCEYIYVSNSDAKQIVHRFIGRKSNVITAAEMGRYLVESILRESATQARAIGEPSSGSWARDFAKGAAASIAMRVTEIIRTSTTPSTGGTGTSLVLASFYQTEKNANALVLAQEFPKLGKGRAGRGATNFDATLRGREYGKNVSLNKQVSGTATTKAIK